MKEQTDRIKYVFEVVHDLHDASGGDVFPGLDKSELDESSTFVNDYLVRPAEQCPMSAVVLTTMLSRMAIDDESRLIPADDPEEIAQHVVDALPDDTDDAYVNQLYDAVQQLAFILTESYGRYK
jgi:hypothetical protein